MDIRSPKRLKERTGINDKFKHMKIRYPFHWRSLISVGPIIATKKFHSQFAEIPMAFLLGLVWLASSGGHAGF
jgi:hypothetical protein